MKFAIYSRKSIISQRGDTIQNQIEMCKNYIYKNFENVSENDIIIFEDFGSSGKDSNRKGFLNMIAYIKEENVGYLVCYKLDRISRNVCDFSKLIEMINKKNIGFISIKEQFDTSTPMGKAMLYIASVFSQLERETICERVKDNMYMLAYKGYWLGGNLPTGYAKMLITKNNKKHFVLKENKNINIVELIYKKMIKYKSITEVLKYLKKNNIKTVKGNDFSNISIREILKNPVYCIYDKNIYKYYKEKGANIVYNEKLMNKNYGIMVYNKRNNKSINDEKNFIISVGKHRGIVTGKEFILVQEMFFKKKYHKNHNRKSLLSGKIICAKCGEKMVFKAHYNIEKNGIYYYICKNKLYNCKKKCDIKNINGKNLDKYIIEKLKINVAFDIFTKRNIVDKKIKNIVWDGKNLFYK